MSWRLVAGASFVVALLQNPARPAEIVASPSFDCQSRSLSATEKSICSDNGLASLDRELATRYREELAKVPPSERAKLIARQKAWLGLRNQCNGVDCIARSYKSRLQELTNPTAKGDPLSELEGYYTSRGHCWAKNGDGSVERCDDGADGDSCLQIRRIDPTHAELSIESSQANGHECGVSGVAELRGDKLVYVQGHAGNDDDGRGLSVDTSGPELTIKYMDEQEQHFTSPFCAINASLELVAFDKKTRESADGKSCTER